MDARIAARGLIVSWAVAAVAFGPCAAVGGGSPLNTLVVLNTRSRRSIEIAEYYCRKRGIPPLNVVRLKVPVRNDITLGDFERLIRRPIQKHMSSFGLAAQIGFIVFCGDFPYRIWKDKAHRNGNSLTSALFYGYHDSPPPCSLPASTRSPLCRLGWGFPRWEREDSGWRPVVVSLLNAWNETQAKRLIDLSVSADCTRPTGTVWLVRTPDFNRNKRWMLYEDAARFVEFARVPVRVVITSTWEVAQVNHVIGYMLGRYAPRKISTIAFLPGALADHFTSWGGYLHDSSWQMSVLDWISNGCVGTCGTVVEPCSYREKFAQPLLFGWYVRGYTMGESYYFSLANPYQSLVVGDPLCSPFAVRPIVKAEWVQTTQSGKHVRYFVTAADEYHPVARVDLYCDGRLRGTVTNIVPQPGNVVIVSIAGTDCIYRVDEDDDFRDVVRGVAAAIRRNKPELAVEVYGDCIELVQRYYTPGSLPPEYSVRVSQGNARLKTVWGWTSSDRFRPGGFRARQPVALKGTPVVGDHLELVVRARNGTGFTSQVAAVEGDTCYSLLGRLQRAVNQCTSAAGPVRITDVEKISPRGEATCSFVSLDTGPDAAATYIEFRVRAGGRGSSLAGGYAGYLTSNVRVLLPRGEVRLACGREQISGEVSVDEWRISPGHSITLLAVDGTAAGGMGWTRVLTFKERDEYVVH